MEPLRYTSAAANWRDGMPIGNGRLGGMVYGGETFQRLQFNEDTLWLGEPHDYSNPAAAAALPQIRTYMFGGNASAASGLIAGQFLSQPLRQLPYQDFGTLWLDFTHHASISSYERTLDLERAVATVEYDNNGVHYTRTFFAGKPHNAIVVRVTADTPGSIDTVISLTSQQDRDDGSYSVTTSGSDRLVLAGRLPFSGNYNGAFRSVTNPLFFEAQVRAEVEGGSLTPAGSVLIVSGADTLTLYLVAHTNYVDYEDVGGDQHALCEADLAALDGVSYETLLNDHVADYQALFDRCSIDLGETAPAIAAQTTGVRKSGFNVNSDPDLAEQYFQFGRYLLIGSSRPGAQPANLQGIWNGLTDPSWECKYTTNINCQMNYWPAEVTNLSELHEPLFDMIDELRSSGHRVAQVHYGADGWVVHHNTDLWRGAAPINNATDGCFPAGAAWLCQHLWWHYEFTGDEPFLENRAYPAMKEAAIFLLESMARDPRPGYNDWLVTVPSNSPEHGGLAIAPTMDNQIIREHFRNTLAAAEVLGVDDDLRTSLTQAIARIPPNRVGEWGQLMEWLEERSEDNPSNQHRHVSHLWGLFPGEDVTPADPAIFDAALVSLAARGTSATNQTGWAMAHRLNLWARALDGDTAFVVLTGLIKNKSYDSLLNNGGGASGFQIDGNFGGTSGIAEMLLQSHGGEIALLPALPAAWPTGSFQGLRARGGAIVGCQWADGALTSATLRATLDRTLKIRLPQGSVLSGVYRIALGGGATPYADNGDGTLTLDAQAGSLYLLWFSEDPPPIDTHADPVWVDFAFGGLEMGTESNPFDTLAEGVGVVEVAGTVFCKQGWTQETATIAKPLRLAAGGGTVVIGRASAGESDAPLRDVSKPLPADGANNLARDWMLYL
jgi:alpha-L-fucosidase 2